MSNLELISEGKHFNKYWRKPSNFEFTRKESFCPITLQELPSAIMSLPVCFLKTDEGYQLGMLLGLKPNSNLAINREGQWLHDYIPAYYRTYPFVLAKTEGGKYSLCINTANYDLATESTEESFFTEQGAPTEIVNDNLNMLSSLTSNLEKTTAACQALVDLELIEPWPISIVEEEKTKTVEGVYRVSEDAFNKISTQQLNDLRDNDALTLIYGQLFSMQNLQKLGRQLAQDNSNMEKPPVELNLDGPNDIDSGNISFSNF